MNILLSLDIGEKRIGLAVSDETGTLARPLFALARASKQQDFTQIAALRDEYHIVRIVAGLPKTLRNEEGPQARRVRRYADELAAAIGIPLEFWDERFSSIEAQERMTAASRQQRDRGAIDAAAAAIILQEYLDAHRAVTN